MPVLDDAKRLTRGPATGDLPGLIREPKPDCFTFADDGKTPNNRLPLILYRSAVSLPAAFDPAAVFEELFASNGWEESWRNGIFDFLHFHSRTHEVLGIARGTATVEFGGAEGRNIEVGPGDVVILPAGTGHRRRSASGDLLVVGAYPAGGSYDQRKPRETDHDEAVRAIAAVGVPARDPVYGADGPLPAIWRSAAPKG